MGIRGRNALVVPISAISRPEPPLHLTEPEAKEWRAVVDRLPPNHFPRETHGLLEQYVGHVVRSRFIAEKLRKIESKKNLDYDAYNKFGRLAERESRCASMLATRMRITQQSLILPTEKRGRPPNKKPWEDEE